VEDVAVEGVDDDWGSCGARDQRCHAADRTGLRGVRVQDVRANLPDQAGDPGHRERVEQRRDLAMDVRKLDDLDP
jgi:hypothetical protein